jgi:hypothetical protein
MTSAPTPLPRIAGTGSSPTSAWPRS